jgi:hypothetical protein
LDGWKGGEGQRGIGKEVEGRKTEGTKGGTKRREKP